MGIKQSAKVFHDALGCFNMADKITYESICEKLGFDVDTYEPTFSDTEDDSVESPFRRLSLEELDFLTDRIENKKDV